MALTCGNCGKSCEDHAPEYDKCKCRLVLKDSKRLLNKVNMTAEELNKIAEKYAKEVITNEDYGKYDCIVDFKAGYRRAEEEHQQKLKEIRDKLNDLYFQEIDMDDYTERFISLKSALEIIDQFLTQPKEEKSNGE